jgi:hypothetical protein
VSHRQLAACRNSNRAFLQNLVQKSNSSQQQ